MSYHLRVKGQFDLSRRLTVKETVEVVRWTEERHEGTDSIGPWCPWRLNDDLTAIVYTEDEINGYDIDGWLIALITNWIEPLSIKVNGYAEWSGEEPGDLGAIWVVGNTVFKRRAFIVVYPPEDWGPVKMKWFGNE